MPEVHDDTYPDELPTPAQGESLQGQNSLKQKPDNPELRLEDLKALGLGHEQEQVEKAFGQIGGFCEFTNPETAEKFDPKDAQALYEYLFPNPDEAESWEDDILPRLQEMRDLPNSPGLKEKYGDSRFHAIVGQKEGATVAYTQFSTMPLENGQVVAFWQYGGVPDEKFMQERYGKTESYRQRDVGRALYALRHKIAADDAKEMGFEKGVAGTILEAEMIGQGDNPNDIRYTKKRLDIHRKLGAKAIMLRMEDGSLETAHLQPRLSADSNPIQLTMMYRPLHYDKSKINTEEPMDKSLAQSLIMSYIDNFIREGFDPKDVEEARQILLEKFSRAKEAVLLPPEKLPTITELARHDPLLRAQVERDYGSLEEHEALVKKSLSEPENAGARTLGM
jgi:hypothetical protein